MEANWLLWLPKSSRHQASWNLLRDLSMRDSRPWLCLGDFNGLLTEDDKLGGAAVQRHLINGFAEAI